MPLIQRDFHCSGLATIIFLGWTAFGLMSCNFQETERPSAPINSQDSLVLKTILDLNGISERSVDFFANTDKITGKIVRLKFSTYDLIALPQSIEKLDQLKELDVEFSGLTFLPEGLCHLNRLENLYLLESNLETVPACLGNLIHLKVLNLRSNNIFNLPSSFGNLDKLVSLDLSSNKFGHIPEVLMGCDSLVVLRMNHNSISTIPDYLGQFPALKELHVWQSGITNILPGISKCQKLWKVDLSDNYIKKLPEEIIHTPKLTDFNIHGNNLCGVSKALADWLDIVDSDWRESNSCF